jgi:hypothetical protein
MICRRLLLAVCAGALLGCFTDSLRAEEAPRKIRMLMLTQSAGFKHGSVSRPADGLAPAEVAMTQLGQQTGLFTVHCTQDAAADFTKENLKNYDLVFFYTTGKLPIKDEDLDYFFNDWLKQKGHGFIGAHSATDTFGDYKPYWDMVGGTFNGHPWGSGTTVTITVHDPKHPAMKPWGEEFQFKDEIYQYKNWQPEKVHVLMSLNMAKTNPKAPYHVPVAWVKNYGDGRVFYTNLGHNNETWANPTFLKSMEGGIRWVLRLEDGDASPNPELSQAQEAKAKADAEQK